MGKWRKYTPEQEVHKKKKERECGSQANLQLQKNAHAQMVLRMLPVWPLLLLLVLPNHQILRTNYRFSGGVVGCWAGAGVCAAGVSVAGDGGGTDAADRTSGGFFFLSVSAGSQQSG